MLLLACSRLRAINTWDMRFAQASTALYMLLPSSLAPFSGMRAHWSPIARLDEALLRARVRRAQETNSPHVSPLFPSSLVLLIRSSLDQQTCARLNAPSKLVCCLSKGGPIGLKRASLNAHRLINDPSKFVRFLPYGGEWSTERLAMGPEPCRYGRRRRWRDALFEVPFGRSRERNKFAEPSSDMSLGPHPSLEQRRPSTST